MYGRSTIAIILIVLLAGCSSNAPDGAESWSTRNESVLGRDLQQPELKVYRPVENQVSLGVLRDAATEILLQAADSENPLLRANSIEALQNNTRYLGPIVRRGLLDTNRGVRFAAAMTVGSHAMSDLAHLLEPLLQDPSQAVRAAAIYGLHQCGGDIDISPLGRMLFSDDPEVRSNVAFILGEMGNPSAVGMLRQAAQRPMVRVDPARARIVDLQIAESLVRLGEFAELEIIRAALFAPQDQGEIVALACQICGRIKDGQALTNLLDLALREGIRKQSAEIRLAATYAIALIDPSRTPLKIALDYRKSAYPAIRAQSALTMGITGDQEVLQYLGPMLSDTDPMVQVSAAGAILRIRQE